jgi:superfamily I DNA/RNA helicase
VSLKNALNPQQHEAVVHTGSPLLILAGAGSGKTRVITYRIAHLIRKEHIPPKNILGVTFTNKAAQEMRQRIVQLIGKDAKELTLCTFHSLGLRILREHAPEIGYRKDFTIYNEGDQLSLIRTILREHPQKREKFDAGIILSRISSFKNRITSGNAEFPWYEDKYDLIMQDMFNEYQQGLRVCQAVDFDDLILLPIRLFETKPGVLLHYQNLFRQILIDEYQDTNHGQYRLISLLAAKHGNLCVVGDDDQSIYGWRGAEVRNILEFEKDFPNARVVKLEQNYRSTQVILDAAYHVIKNNYKRQDKRLWTNSGRGKNIDAFIAKDENDEAKTIAWRILTIQERTQCKWSDFAILYRSNIQSRALETSLRINKIPYTVFGGYEFFDRKEIKDLISYLKVVLNPNDDLSLLRIINYPRRSIGNQTILQIQEEATEKKCSVIDILREWKMGDKCSKATQQGIILLLDLIDTHHEKIQTGKVDQMVRSVIEHSGYREELERTIDDPLQAQAKIEIVEELASAASAFVEQNPASHLTDFVDSISLGDQPGSGGKKRVIDNSVTLATLHSAKGLEFPYVFLCGMEEDLLPHSRSVLDSSDVDEERRLCYVGMTRAQVHLTLSFTEERNKYGRKAKRKPSRFLMEIPEELLCKQFSHSVNFFDRQIIRGNGKMQHQAEGQALGTVQV